MSYVTCVCRNVLRLSFLSLLCAVPSFADVLGATATYTSTANSVTGGLYDYNLTLTNTGTAGIGTFWFSWLPGAGFLTATPTAVFSPSNWTAKSTNAGAAIQWTTTSGLLQPGGVLSGFAFDSTETPDQLLLSYTKAGALFGTPDLTFVVYPVAPPTGTSATFLATAATPEPGTILLTFTGVGVVFGSIRSRLIGRL